MPRMRLGVSVLIVLLSGAPALLAQAPAPAAPAGDAPADATQSPAPAPATPDAKTTPASLPVDISHIKAQAEKQPAVKLDDQQLKFYVLVLAKEPKWADIVGNYDLMNGATKGGAAMTHSEFMKMVTPKELNELFSMNSSSSFAMLQAALVNAAGQALIKKAALDLRAAHSAREIQTIRERIDRELAALLGK